MLHITKSNLKEYLGFAVFFLVFLIIYYFLNLFVLSQYFKLFNLKPSLGFDILLIILTLSYILAAALESYSDNYLFRKIYLVASVWMGILFISFVVLLIYYILDMFIPITKLLTGIIIALAAILISLYGIINAYTLTVTKVNVHNNKGAKLKVVQVSDVHLGIIIGDNYLKQIVSKINAIHPDVVLLTGDLIDGRYSYDVNTFKLLDNIHADIYFVSGNHEDYAGIAKVEGLLKNTKVNWLHNELINYKGINIIGLDDTRNKHNVGIMLSKLNKVHHGFSNKFTLLMNHRPIGWKDASKYVDMMISGHTHAGQIWPFIYLTFLEGNAMRNKHIIYDDMTFILYISSGVGTWGPPMRIGSHAEIVVYNIMNKK